MGYRPGMMADWRSIRPRVAFSRCFGFEACRYDGGIEVHGVIETLQAACETVAVCPELRVGLGVPRPPIRIVRGRLIQPSTGRDLTDDMAEVVADFAQRTLPDLDGIVLKSRSPSCGRGDTRQYGHVDDAEPTARGDGLFASRLARMAPDLAWADETRLADATWRPTFLAQLWTLATARQLTRWPGSDYAEWHSQLLDQHGAPHRATLRAAARLAASPALRQGLTTLAEAPRANTRNQPHPWPESWPEQAGTEM